LERCPGLASTENACEEVFGTEAAAIEREEEERYYRSIFHRSALLYEME
jgi:hypothetical protein